MLDRRELDVVDRDVDKAADLLKAAEHSIRTAKSIAEDDPDSALAILWDRVAFQALTAALLLAGYRVTSREGHHRVAVDACRLLLTDDKLVSRIGTLRRTRDRGMYEFEPAHKDEVDAAIKDCEDLVQLVMEAVKRARTAG